MIAMAQPCSSPGCNGDVPKRACSYVDRWTEAPPDAKFVQPIYFLPADANDGSWDKPITCSDGWSRESVIGLSLYNQKVWMARAADQEGASSSAGYFRARSFNSRRKTLSEGQFQFYDVRFYRDYLPTHNDSWYSSSGTHSKIFNELVAAGFDAPQLRYLVYANTSYAANYTLGSTTIAANGSGQSVAYHRWKTQVGDRRYQAFGCPYYDKPGLHELIHAAGGVNPDADDYVNTPFAGGHVTQSNDLMYSDDGGNSFVGSGGSLTQWDLGAMSYTAQFLGPSGPFYPYIASASGYGGGYNSNESACAG